MQPKTTVVFWVHSCGFYADQSTAKSKPRLLWAIRNTPVDWFTFRVLHTLNWLSSTEYVSQTSPNSTTAGMGKHGKTAYMPCVHVFLKKAIAIFFLNVVGDGGSTWSEAFGWKAQCENTWLAKLLANVSCYEILKVRHGTGSSVGFSVFLHPSSLVPSCWSAPIGGSIAASSRKRGGEHELGLSDPVDVSGTFGTSMWWVQWSWYPGFLCEAVLISRTPSYHVFKQGEKTLQNDPCSSGGWCCFSLAALFPSQTGCGERKAYKKSRVDSAHYRPIRGPWTSAKNYLWIINIIWYMWCMQVNYI